MVFTDTVYMPLGILLILIFLPLTYPSTVFTVLPSLLIKVTSAEGLSMVRVM